MMLSSCFYSDVIDEDGTEEDEEDEFAMTIDSIRSSISLSGNVQEGLPLLSSSLPSVQFANFSIGSSVADDNRFIILMLSLY
jgi:hypothetical protein